MSERSLLTLPDGRTLQYHVDGPADGAALLYHHGTPGSAVPVPALVEAASARGLRSIMAARPGYGASSPQPDRSVADAGADAAALLDHLGVATFVTAGWSGGGPHALATAVLLPGRCRAVATIGGVAPWDAGRLDWLAGMGDENRIEFGLAVQGVQPLDAGLAAQRPALLEVTAPELVEAMGGLLPEVDRDELAGPLGAMIVASFHEGLAHGVSGWRDDDLAFVKPWGVDLGRLSVPLTVWQGDCDLMVPEAHGRWLAEHVPGATARLRPGHGHLSLLGRFAPDIVAELAAGL